MTESNLLVEKGQLIEELRPAVYLDASVVIGYWSVEGLESDPKETAFKPVELPYYQTIRELLAEPGHLFSPNSMRFERGVS